MGISGYVQTWLSHATGRVLAIIGLFGIATGACLVLLMHLIPPSGDVNPVRRTISEYALLSNGWLFDLAVLSLATGSAAVVAAVIRGRLSAAASVGTVALLGWSVGLVMVVAFPKHNWAVGPSATGAIHRVASLLAFLSLPAGAIWLARAWRGHPRWRGHASRTYWLGVASLVCFSPIGIAIMIEPITGIRWWRAIPLGAVERVLALVEVATVLALGWWSLQAGNRTLRSPMSRTRERSGRMT